MWLWLHVNYRHLLQSRGGWGGGSVSMHSTHVNGATWLKSSFAISSPCFPWKQETTSGIRWRRHQNAHSLTHARTPHVTVWCGLMRLSSNSGFCLINMEVKLKLQVLDELRGSNSKKFSWGSGFFHCSFHHDIRAIGLLELLQNYFLISLYIHSWFLMICKKKKRNFITLLNYCVSLVCFFTVNMTTNLLRGTTLP